MKYHFLILTISRTMMTCPVVKNETPLFETHRIASASPTHTSACMSEHGIRTLEMI